MLESQGLLMEHVKEIIQPFISVNKKNTERARLGTQTSKVISRKLNVKILSTHHNQERKRGMRNMKSGDQTPF